MLSKFLYTSLIPVIAFNGLTINESINQTKSNDIIQNDIMSDISNVCEINDINLDSVISFEQRTLKQLFVLGSEFNWKKWKTIRKHYFSFPVSFDLNKMQASVRAFPNEINQEYVDPEPTWCDPVGAKWNKKTKTIRIKGNNVINTKITSNSQWYGNDLTAQFHQKASDWIDDGVILSYPNHSYVTHQIRMYVNGSYKKETIDKKITIKQIENKNIIKTFLQQNKIELTNNGLVWNSKSIQQCPNLFSFNIDFKILKTLSYANELVNKLEEFKLNNIVNNIWTNNNISQYCIEHNINSLKNLMFNNYENLIELNDNIFNNNEYYLNGDFKNNVDSLKTNLLTNEVIKNEEDLNTLTDFANLYEMLILFFKNNKITTNLMINNKPSKVEIWNGSSFCNIYEQISQENLNILSVQFESLNVEYINDKNLSKEINDNWLLDKQNYDSIWLENLSFYICYRNDARNISGSISTLSTQNGILLNLNKYVSELIGTGIEQNGSTKNQFISNSEQNIKTHLNSLFEYNSSSNIIEKIYDISTNSKSQLLENIKFNSLKLSAQIFNINFDDWFEYQPSNYEGNFYIIMQIKNWKFSDGTDGDFTSSFKQNFFMELNKNNTNIVELESKNNDGYFLCKLRTNKIIFEYFDNRPIIEINNINTIKSAIKDWYIQLIDKNNWYTCKDISYKSSLTSTKKFFTTTYKNKIIEKLKNLNLTIHINSINFWSPNSIDDKQFLFDCNKNPLFKYINHCQKQNSFNVMNNDELTYITNNNQNDIAIDVDLWDFYKNFYNEELEKIISEISNNVCKIFDYIEMQSNLNSWIEKKDNWFPLIILLIGSSVIFTLCLLIILLYKHRKNNLN